MPQVIVNRRGADRIRGGHPWIYRSDVVSAEADAGDLVRVVSDRQHAMGWALWSSASQISLRMIAGGAEPEIDERAWLERTLRAAIDYRARLGIEGDVCRLVHGEADGLPALIVDRYGSTLVVQTLCQGMDRRLPLLTELLCQLAAPDGILARNDPKVRRLEGLESAVEVVQGTVPETLRVRENAMQLDVDVFHGQKTGLFLDQRENYLAAARYASGRGLDAFAYRGGFALHLATACSSVLALDSSTPAVEATRRHAALNGFENIEAREANVFDALRDLDAIGDRFQTVVLDPPAFARNKAAVPRALGGYKEINLRALKLLEPGGFLVTSSCSYNVSETLFTEVVAAAAADARVPVVIVERRAQARDHPVRLGVPETHYLKCLVLRVLP